MDQQFDRLRQLIADQQGYPAKRITLDTRLQTDVGMAGDDGDEFLQRFQEEFSVDMSTLQYDRHFEPEGLPAAPALALVAAGVVLIYTSVAWPWLIPVWVLALYVLSRRNSRAEHPGEIRVSDLLRSAEAQRWTYDYPPPTQRG